MDERRLKSLLREAPVPGAEEAERRGRAVVAAAFAERSSGERAATPSLPRLALALAVATLLTALLLSPAGAAVRDWVDDVFTAGVPGAEPALTEIPGGGRLLVQSDAGPWVVEADGSRRLLGDYSEATWSPRGLYVGVASGQTLSAVEPNGTPRWSLSANGPVADPRWSPSGFAIAYRVGDSLRFTAADGTGDELLARHIRPLPPAWSSRGLPLLAYVDATGALRVANPESGKTVASAAALPAASGLEWAADDSALLEASATTLRLRDVEVGKLIDAARLGPPREVVLPKRTRIVDAALSPDGKAIAVLLSLGGPKAPRSSVVLADAGGGPPRPLLRTPGRLTELGWSPDGSRLLIAWPEADQWLFVPTGGGGRVRAIGDIARQFAPGAEVGAPFPTIAGWCCESP
jgi:WD40-like Beta Propeller Repeat